MVFIAEVTYLIITFFVCFLAWQYTRPKGFPSGPRGLPIVGCLPFITTASHKYYAKLAQKYGGVYSIRLGRQDVVILNDWTAIKEMLVVKGEIFAARPPLLSWKASLKNTDIVTTNGPIWKEQKRFTLQHLRDFGFGKVSMELTIMEEVNNILEHLEGKLNDKVLISHMFFAPILSIISKISTGKTYDLTDGFTKELGEAITNNFDFFKVDTTLNFMPYLRFIPGATIYKKAISNHRKVYNSIDDEIKRHVDTYTKGSPRDFIDVYLKELIDRKRSDTSQTPYKQNHINGTIYNLFNAGVETTQHTLSFGFLYLALWPEVQQKVRMEIQEVIGTGRSPYYTDRHLLPYTQATILEIHRYASVVPLSFPHSAIRTTTLMGYTIPKGTCIIQNIWAINNDRDLWEDPELFRPERFLDAHGKVQKPEHLIPFSLGPRFCMGESLAKMELFLFFTCLLQRFSFHCIIGEKPPRLEAITSLTLRPQPFHLSIKQA